MSPLKKVIDDLIQLGWTLEDVYQFIDAEQFKNKKCKMICTKISDYDSQEVESDPNES